MFGAVPLLVAVLAVGASDVKNPALAEGIRLYDALDYAGALQALTQALDRPSSRSDSARIHLYIGLIQNRYKLKQDAEASFGRAIDYDPRVRLPKGTPQTAKAMFSKIKKDKLGEDDDAPSQTVKKKKVVKKKNNQESDDDSDGASADRAGEGEDETREAREAREARETRTATSATSGNAALAMNTTHDNGNDETNSAPLDHKLEKHEPDHRIVPPTSSTELEHDSGGPIGGWIAIGIGAAAAATGVTFAVLSTVNGQASDDEPVANRTKALYDTAVQQRTLSFVSFGVSAAAIGVAAVLFLSD